MLEPDNSCAYQDAVSTSSFKKLTEQMGVGIFCALTVLVAGCQNLQEQPSIRTEKMTVATAQRHVRIGMTSSEVIDALGSPNLVSTDDKRRETWAYDKVSSDAVDTRSSVSTGLIFFPILFAEGGSHRSSRNQRTLTIVIKFDERSKVRDFAYHSSSF
jgi:outer membrane protein assembly factor BamE (lipoprotein component of BamABCDE complex)